MITFNEEHASFGVSVEINLLLSDFDCVEDGQRILDLAHANLTEKLDLIMAGHKYQDLADS